MARFCVSGLRLLLICSTILLISEAFSRFTVQKSHRTMRQQKQFHPWKITIQHPLASSHHSIPGRAWQTVPRGGASLQLLSLFPLASTPQSHFQFELLRLALATVIFKVLSERTSGNSTTTAASASASKPSAVQSLQRRFLSVFWLIRCADWLQGPYFYEVYASKLVNGAAAPLTLISQLFLTGFASTAIFGPSVGRLADVYGRKKATLAFTLIYALGAWSTKSLFLAILFGGRILSGIGTSLLFSAPESWLVGEARRQKQEAYLGETFGLAYAGDSIVAIVAGQMAALAASKRGPTGPFELSVAFLAMGGLLASILWSENKAEPASDRAQTTIADAVAVIRNDPNIWLVGSVQSLFEAAMYIFVLQWPPAVSKAIAKAYGSSAATPYGTIFSCLMASCLFGSTVFSQVRSPTEVYTTVMLAVATVSMSLATWTVSSSSSLTTLITAFFVFEGCVGMYFPSIGILRSKYIPDSHRSVIMNLFGIPLNILVVAVFLSIGRLGVSGALGISSTALALATTAMFALKRRTTVGSAESK